MERPDLNGDLPSLRRNPSHSNYHVLLLRASNAHKSFREHVWPILVRGNRIFSKRVVDKALKALIMEKTEKAWVADAFRASNRRLCSWLDRDLEPFGYYC